jgi:hypothetical protein
MTDYPPGPPPISPPVISVWYTMVEWEFSTDAREMIRFAFERDRLPQLKLKCIASVIIRKSIFWKTACEFDKKCVEYSTGRVLEILHDEDLLSYNNAAEQAAIIREIINPFHSGKVEVVSSAAAQLAYSIDHDRKWEAMPVLADALEESGWRDAEILYHLRSNTKHYRGCWALDLVLGENPNETG